MWSGWKVYYTNNRIFESKYVDWIQLPESGVLFVVVYFTAGRKIYSGGDWYYLVNNKFDYVPSGKWGTWKPKPNVSCLSCIKQGVGVSDEEFNKLRQIVFENK